MKCPHCLTNFHAEPHEADIVWKNAVLTEGDGTFLVYRSLKCSACLRAIVSLSARKWISGPGGNSSLRSGPERQVWPKGVARSPLPVEVVDPFASDYREACNVLSDSPKASAALGRRCLQSLLRDKAGVKKGNLYDEIEQVVTGTTLPSDLAEALHHVRVIGNFAAHPEKSTNTGAIIDVEPGEADWTLDVLESLFDFYFVRPAKLAARKTEINKKLIDAGKEPLK